MKNKTEIQEELASAVVLRKALSYALECYPNLMTYISEIALSERAGRSLLRYIEALERIAKKAENSLEFKLELKMLQEIVETDPYSMIQEVKPVRGEASRG